MVKNRARIKEFWDFLVDHERNLMIGLLSMIGLELFLIFVEGFIGFSLKAYTVVFLINLMEMGLGWIIVEVSDDIIGDWKYFKAVVLKERFNYKGENEDE